MAVTVCCARPDKEATAMTANARTVIALLAVTAVLSISAAASGQTIWGTSSATYPNDPGFEGMWKYCLEIGWDTTGHGLSHTVLFIGLEICPLYCDEGFFAFPVPAGTGPGEGGCTAIYYGSFLCEGDPTMPEVDVPTIKFEYDEDIGCEPAAVGTAILCFYSVGIPTTPDVFVDYLGIKYGSNTATGDLEGVLPSCVMSPVEAATWGGVKALYR
jgi:hypothetical protein